MTNKSMHMKRSRYEFIEYFRTKCVNIPMNCMRIRFGRSPNRSKRKQVTAMLFFCFLCFFCPLKCCAPFLTCTKTKIHIAHKRFVYLMVCIFFFLGLFLASIEANTVLEFTMRLFNSIISNWLIKNKFKLILIK